LIFFSKEDLGVEYPHPHPMNPQDSLS